MLDELLALRERVGLLSRLSESELSDLGAELEEVHCHPGETLLEAGRDAPSSDVALERVFIVLGGRLRADDAREIGPGELIGAAAFFAGGETGEDVRAVEPSRLAALSRAGLERLWARNPEIVRRIYELVSAEMRRPQLSVALDRLFGPFAEHEVDGLRQLEREVELLTLASGETLFRQAGDPDAAYIVLSGRLRVAIETPEGVERFVNEVGRGETVGEMGLLTGERRSATIYAVRDSELARLSRDAFLRLIERRPRSLLNLSRIIIERLRHQSSGAAVKSTSAVSFGLLPAGASVPLDEVARDLAVALAAHGSVALLASAEVDRALGRAGIAQAARTEPAHFRLTQWLHEREALFRYVVYVADQAWSPWTERCARHADRVLLAAVADGAPEPGAIEEQLARRGRGSREPQRSLLLLHGERAPTGTARWLDRRDVDKHYHLRLGVADDYARVARYLTGNAVAVVLGGGGARGLAHAGVLRALGELGIPIDRIGGCSIGAVIAGMYALSRDWRAVEEYCSWAFESLFDYTWPAVSMLRGRALNRNIHAVTGDSRIEDLWVPYFAVSTDLTTAEEVVHQRGRLFDAVRASVALPGIFPPAQQESHYHVDGGILNNVPVGVMRERGGDGPLLAFDVSSGARLQADPQLTTELSGWKFLGRRFNPLAQRPRGPGILNLLLRATLVGGAATRNRTKSLADLYLELPLGEWGLLDFEAGPAIAARGYEAAIGPLQDWWSRRR